MTELTSNREVILTNGLRVALIVVVLATVVPFGAVTPFWFQFATLLNAVIFACTLAIPFRNFELLRVYTAALITILLFAAYLVLQSVTLPNNLFANSIWPLARAALHIEKGTISIDPATTLATIPQLVHPFLIFMSALVLHQNDDAAGLFWRRLSLIGAGVAVLGIAQHVVAPDSLLFGKKLHYLDSVTGTFVNRNSAATFFGLSSVLIAAMLVRQFHRWSADHDQTTPVGSDARRHKNELLLYCSMFLVVLLGLFLTKSRGGLIATFIPLLIMAAWFGYSTLPSASSIRLRVGIAIAAMTVLIVMFAVLGARSLLRLEQGGIEDHRWCIYAATVNAIRDNPWFGTGFGTFEQVFPAYRNPLCGVSGLWDRAHNSFLEGYLGMGLPFAIGIAFVGGYLLRIFLIGYRTRWRYRIIPIAGVGMLLLVMLHSLVDFSIQIPGVSAYLAAALGAAVSISLGRKGRARDKMTDLS